MYSQILIQCYIKFTKNMGIGSFGDMYPIITLEESNILKWKDLITL